ncbi:porin [Dyella subtropica]|uniref:porin n=1 Tax=Dyella subtropica TaxID=2992127 RepID=UPI00224D11FB|nr:porin [Dyella subtropica]
MKKKTLASVLWTMGAAAFSEASPAAALDLYVDRKTQQIFAEPGTGRVKLGTFVQVDEQGGEPQTAKAPLPQQASATATAASSTPNSTKPAAKKWYERINVRGYTQLRYNQGVGGDAGMLRSPSDRFIGDNQGFGIRRARVVLSGDITDSVSFYLQPDFASTPSGSSTSNFAQLRDAYADIYFDKDREYRVRAGQSKVPYGWENLQSSQNRLAPDRADALNSGVRDERDLGLFFYYTPTAVQERFQYLVKSGLKGSGDYGVFGLGFYNGQGANRAERNNSLHTVLHFTYPFKFANGQYMEVGADAYSGRFKIAAPSAVTVNGENFTPVDTAPKEGSLDQRVAVHAIYYPQPFGLQAEWTVGRGPQLDLAEGRIRTRSLRGGYVQAMYKFDSGSTGTWMPYIKWQSYRGASKFDTNTPHMLVNETELGVEWQPNTAVEIAVAYANMHRTNVSEAPYRRVRGDLLRVQLQVNY